MAGEFDYNVVIRGIDAAIAGLGKLNKALGLGEDKAEKHAGAMDALGDQIAEVARLFGTQEAKAKTLFNALTEGANSVEEAMLGVVAIEKTFNNSLAQTGDAEKAATTAIKKGNKILKDRTTARQEQIKIEEQYQTALEESSKLESKPNRLVINKKNNAGLRSEINKKNRQAGEETDRVGVEADVAARARADKQFAEIMLAGYLEQRDAMEAGRKAIETEQLAIEKMYANLFDQAALRDIAARKQQSDPRQTMYDKLFSEGGTQDQQAVAARNIKPKEVVDNTKQLIDDELKAKMAFYQDDLKAYNKISDAKAAKDEAVLQKKLKDARAYLQFQQDLEDGLTKKQVSNISGEKAGSIDRGAAVVLEAEADAHSRLAKEIETERVAIKKASDAKKEYIDRATAADAKVKEFTLSWQTMGRIIVAQAFNEAFFAIQNGIRSAVTEAEELYKAVAEVQTIVSQSARGTAEYFGAVEQILQTSSEINFTPQDTANAFYETLSNQIGDSVTQIRAFIGEAGNLGKVTHSTLADSADAITAVINSYSLSVSDAAEISAELFTLVDQGRVKLEEVANHMGNVSVPASQLGVDFKSVVAALSAISIAGIPAREAMTLQRNVMFKLIDPTEKMTQLFGKWGVSSAEAAIAAFGFTGVLQRLAVEAEKGDEEIAALMGTIRGTRGILGLTGDNFVKYTNALEAANKATETYSKTVNEYLSNPGERFAKLQQEISNEFVRMGLRIVNLAANIDSFFRDVESGESAVASFISTIAKWALVIGSATTAFLLVASAIGSTVAIVGTLIAVLGAPVLGPIAIVTAVLGGLSALLVGGVAAFAAFGTTAQEEFAKIQATAVKMNEGVSKSFETGILGSLKEFSESAGDKAQAALAALANEISSLNGAAKKQDAKVALEDLAEGLDSLIKAYGGSDVDQKLIKIFNSAERVREIFGDSADWSLDALKEVVSAHDKEADAIQKKIDKLEDYRNKIMDVAGANRIALAQDITNRNINALAPNQRGQAQFQAAQSAANAAANAADPEESKRLFEVARSFLQDAERTAFETGAFGTIENHTQFFNQQQSALVAMQERRLYAEDQYIKRQQESLELQRQSTLETQDKFQAEVDARKTLEDQYGLEKAILEEYKRIRDQILKNNQLSAEERAAKLVELNRQTESGLNAIGASQFTRDQFAPEFGKNESQLLEEVLATQEERLTKRKKEAAAAAELAEQSVKKFGTALTDMSSQLLAAALQVNDAMKTTKVITVPSGGARAVSIEDPRVTQIVSDLETLIASAQREQDPISQADFQQGLREIYNRLAPISGESGDKLAQDALKKVFQLFEPVEDLRQTSVDFTASANAMVESLDLMTAEIVNTISRIKSGENPAETYDRRLREQGNAGSSEDEGDSSSSGVFDLDGLIKYLNPKFERLFNIMALGQQEVQKQTQEIQKLPEQTQQTQQTQQPNYGQPQFSSGGQKSRGQLLYEQQQERLAGFATNKSRGQQLYEKQQERLAGFAGEQAMLQQQQQAINAQRDAANAQQKAAEAQFSKQQEIELIKQEAINAYQQLPDSVKQVFSGIADYIRQQTGQALPTINGQPQYPEAGGARINGELIQPKPYPENFINGVPWIDDGAAAASASFAVEQGVQTGAQAIPQAMELGAQSIYDAIKAALPTQQTPQYYAKGGPVGTDTVPAWLSPGEFVVNARAARSNFSWLQAINTHGNASRFANGGPVSQSQSFVNNFNVTSSNPNAQVGAIVGAIRRQISQGKATLSKRRPY